MTIKLIVHMQFMRLHMQQYQASRKLFTHELLVSFAINEDRKTNTIRLQNTPIYIHPAVVFRFFDPGFRPNRKINSFTYSDLNSFRDVRCYHLFRQSYCFFFSLFIYFIFIFIFKGEICHRAKPVRERFIQIFFLFRKKPQHTRQKMQNPKTHENSHAVRQNK